MALTRVQASPQVQINGWINVATTFSSTPVVGNAIIVFITFNGTNVTGVTDNKGNTYSVAAQKHHASHATEANIWYCSKITSSSATFTITAAFPGFGNATIVAVEYNGIPTAGLDILTTSNNEGNSTTPSTGNAATLAINDVILAASFSHAPNNTTIVVETVSPAWNQEIEQLSSTYGGGEGDSRILTAGSGVVPSCSWVWTVSAGQWAAVIVAFGDGTIIPPTVSNERTQLSVSLG
jgi:hypothetical protein